MDGLVTALDLAANTIVSCRMDQAAVHAIIKNLPYPVAGKADDITNLLKDYSVCGIGGEAGSGKSTVVPFMAAAVVKGRIIVIQPRRLAAIAVCRRLNELSAQGAGRTAGFVVRYERDEKVTDQILCVTTGVFLRMIAGDPELSGIGAVIIDEIHERSLESDLCWVLAKNAQELYRPDLKLIVMSASVAEDLLAAAGIRGYGWITVPGRLFPVETRYSPAGDYSDETTYCASVVRDVCEQTPGDVLVFLPGEREIRKAHELLDPLSRNGFQILELFGRMNPEDQKRVLEKTDGRRRIILATNIAQTSLTIEGIACVVDSGLERRVYEYPGEAASSMVTERISAASALQRLGRAGRLGPGKAVRLWDAREKLVPQDIPAIFREDNARLALELARWGDCQLDHYQWLSPPDPDRYRHAIQFLRDIKLLDKDGRLTKKGALCAASSVPPSFASAIFDSESPLQKTSMLLTALLLEERNPKLSLDDFSLLEPSKVLKDSRLASAAHKEARGFGFTPVALQSADFDMAALVRNFAPGIGLLDREKNYRLAAGPTLKLKAERNAPDALVVFRGDHRTATGVIHQYLSLDAGLLRPVLRENALIEKEVVYNRERKAFQAIRRELFGSLVLSETRTAPEHMSDTTEAFYRLLEKEGPAILHWDDKARLLQERISCLKAAVVTDDTLVRAIKSYYGDTLKNPEQIRIADVLLSMVKPTLRTQIRDLDEKRFRLENGRSARLRYERDGRIIASAKVQDFFGVKKNPIIAGVTVVAELLSPAGRPVQVTGDLAGFWKSGYESVRKDLAGRYPKHKWPVDPVHP